MKITGQCKEDFEKWFLKQWDIKKLEYFYFLTSSMQYGVFVDFFDGFYVLVL